MIIQEKTSFNIFPQVFHIFFHIHRAYSVEKENLYKYRGKTWRKQYIFHTTPIRGKTSKFNGFFKLSTIFCPTTTPSTNKLLFLLLFPKTASTKTERNPTMKFSCEKILLQTATGTASRAVATKSSIPALEGILLQAGLLLTISGYNMQTGIRTKLEADIVEEGSLVLPARLLGEIIRRLPDDIVTLTSDEKLNVNLTCGDTTYDILALSANDYPELPEVEDQYSIQIQQKKLHAMISETSFAISTDETRPVHTGSLFEIDNKSLTIVSVDGFQLALRKESLEQSEGGNFHFVAPGSALNEIEKICEDSEDTATITLGNRHLLFEVGPTQLICRRLEGDFLDYKSAIPRTNPISIITDTRPMIESIERVSVVNSDKQKSPVRCIFNKDHVLMTVKTGIGEAKDVCRVSGDGNGLEIGFNNRYLINALKFAPADTVRMELNTGISPCIITPIDNEEQFLYMVLPVRLKKH